MLTLRLGEYEHELPAIGYGTMQLSMAVSDQEAINEFIAKVYQQGVRVFDSASAYGNEVEVSTALKACATGTPPFIITKCGISLNHGGQYTDTPAELTKSLEQSLQNLNGLPIDLFMLHRIDPNVSAQRFREIIRTLKSFAKSGQVKAIGISEPTAQQLRDCYQIEPLDVPITAVEIAYSVMSRRAELNGVIDVCRDLNVGVIAYTSIVRGAMNSNLLQLNKNEIKTLSAQDLQRRVFKLIGIDPDDKFMQGVGFFKTEVIKKNVSALLAFHQDAARLGVTPSQLSLSWLVNQGVLPIPGTTSDEHLHENTAVMYQPIAKAETDKLSLKYPPGTFMGNPNPDALNKLDNMSLEPGLKPTAINMSDIRQIVFDVLTTQPNTNASLKAIIAGRANRALSQAIQAGQVLDCSDKLLAISIAEYDVDSQQRAHAEFGLNNRPQNARIDAHTCFNINSVSKFIMMNLIMRMIMHGECQLDDTLDRYLHDMPIPNKEHITIRHCLSHTSGLQDKQSLITQHRHSPIEQLLDENSTVPLGEFYYANVNYHVLAHVIEKATNKPIEEVFQAHIAEPLNVTDTVLAHQHDLQPYCQGYKYKKSMQQFKEFSDVIIFGANSFRSTPSDITKILTHFFEDDTYISSSLRQEVMASCRQVNFIVKTRQQTFEWPAVMGLGIEQHSTPFGEAYGHGGWNDGYACFAIYIPRLKRSVAVSVTKTQGLTKSLQEKLEHKSSARHLLESTMTYFHDPEPVDEPTGTESRADRKEQRSPYSHQ